MKWNWLFQRLLLTGGVFSLTRTPVLSQELQKIKIQSDTTPGTNSCSDQVNVAQYRLQSRTDLLPSISQKLP